MLRWQLLPRLSCPSCQQCAALSKVGLFVNILPGSLLSSSHCWHPCCCHCCPPLVSIIPLQLQKVHDDNARGSNATNNNCTKTLLSEEDRQTHAININHQHCHCHYQCHCDLSAPNQKFLWLCRRRQCHCHHCFCPSQPHCHAHGNNLYGYEGQALKIWYFKIAKVYI